jgi:methylated-DNA-[protein]-cysteine S-methyltransferase
MYAIAFPFPTPRRLIPFHSMSQPPQLTHVSILSSPVGPLRLAATNEGLVGIYFSPFTHGPSEREMSAWREDDGGAGAASRSLTATRAQLTEYFAGTRTAFDLPLAPRGTPFQLEVWMALRAIPYGEVISYGELARRVGDPKASRAVGAANGRNPLSIVVPCHRVIGSGGALTGFGGGIENKRWLLTHEGALTPSL